MPSCPVTGRLKIGCGIWICGRLISGATNCFSKRNLRRWVPSSCIPGRMTRITGRASPFAESCGSGSGRLPWYPARRSCWNGCWINYSSESLWRIFRRQYCRQNWRCSWNKWIGPSEMFWWGFSEIRNSWTSVSSGISIICLPVWWNNPPIPSAMWRSINPGISSDGTLESGIMEKWRSIMRCRAIPFGSCPVIPKRHTTGLR